MKKLIKQQKKLNGINLKSIRNAINPAVVVAVAHRVIAVHLVIATKKRKMENHIIRMNVAGAGLLKKRNLKNPNQEEIAQDLAEVLLQTIMIEK